MSKHKIVMYGGAFNPPHRDHTGIITRLLEEVSDQVLIIPTGKRTDKEYMGVSDEDREDMIRLATEEYGKQVEIDTTFLYGDMPTTTLNQANYLREKYGREIPQVFGSDVAPKMNGWDPTGYVPYRLPKVFIARPGHPIESGSIANYDTIEYESRGFSSTAVRREVERILRGDYSTIEFLQTMIHDKVADFIFQNGLFVPV